MTIQVNGDLRDIEPDTTVLMLLEQLKLKPGNVAVELNRRLLRSEKYQTVLKANDVVEIVTFVGGG